MEPELLQAVVDVESSGRGFTTGPDGEQRIKIQFEPHWFVRLLKRKGVAATGKRLPDRTYQVHIDGELVLENRVDVQGREWAAYERAAGIDPEVAMLSTSWGLGQVMGFNAQRLGYADVGEMVMLFEQGEEHQIEGMLRFIKATRARPSHRENILEDLKAHDFHWFAHGYNGSSYKRFRYDTRIRDAYHKYKAQGG